jgi:hypothetical protein
MEGITGVERANQHSPRRRASPGESSQARKETGGNSREPLRNRTVVTRQNVLATSGSLKLHSGGLGTDHHADELVSQ